MIGSIQYNIIGSFLNDESTHNLIDNLQEQDFTDIFCKKAIKGIKQLREQSKDITVFNLKEVSNLDIMDILNVTGTITTTANIEHNIRTLREHSARLQLADKSELIKAMATDKTKTITQIKNDILEEIQNIKEVSNEEVETLKESMFKTYNILEDRYNNKDTNDLYTGLTKFDSITAGLHKEELTTIASRPGVGKSIIGMQFALNLVKRKNKVLFVSLEMSTTQLCERIISANSEVDGNKLRLGTINNPEDWGKIQQVASRFSFEDLLIDKTSRNIQHIRSKIRKYKPNVVIIDYLQLLQSVNREYSREREVAVITRDLKMMTLEFKIPIIMLAQLNRNADGNRPMLSDLRESGAIEQDSDNVIFLHEPRDKEISELITKGTYPITFFDYLKENQYKLSYIIIEKQRNGAVGTIPVIKRPKYMNFKEVE